MAKILKSDLSPKARFSLSWEWCVALLNRLVKWCAGMLKRLITWSSTGFKNLDNRDHMIQGMMSAVQFLTIIPYKGRHTFNARAALPFFPICGLVIGMTVVVVDALASLVWPGPVVAMIDIIALAVISGALHLDGLADTADGLYSQRAPEQALSIMKDSRVGAMGLVVVICTLGLKWGAVANMAAHYKVWLLIVPAYARATVLFGTRYLPYGRPEGGTGHDQFSTPLGLKDFWSLGLLIPLSFFTSWGFIALHIGFAVIMFGALWWYRRKINGITGDMFGALIEVTETGLFLIAASRWAG